MEIHEAAKKGDFEIFKELIDQGADISATDKYGFTALMNASEHGHLEIVKLLVSNGADVNQKNLLGWSSLCYAATRRQLPVVKFLVDNGADIDADCQGQPIIKWVLQQATNHQPDEEKLLEIIEYFFTKGVKTNRQILDFAKEVHRDRSFQCYSGSQTNDSVNHTNKTEIINQNKATCQNEAADQGKAANQSKAINQNYYSNPTDDTHQINDASHTVYNGSNIIRCPYCGKELSPLASSLLLQSDKLVDCQTQCSFCKRMIYKKDIASALPKKKKFWQIWK